MESVPLRISVLARLLPALSYLLPPIGAALSALLFTRVMQGMAYAETAGMSAWVGGLYESNLAVIIALYLAIVCGVGAMVLVVVRSIVPTSTASPPGWLFLIGGSSALIPVALLWEAESMLIGAVTAPIQGIAYAASMIGSLLTATMIAAPVLVLLLLIGSLLPISSRAKPKWGPLIVLTLVELALIAAVIAFQVRSSWLQQIAIRTM